MRWSLAVGLMVLTSPAVAQDRLPAQVYACANVADDAQRHQCFDALVPELKKQAQQQVANLGLPSAKQSPLTAPAGTPARPGQAEPDKVRLAVTSISVGADGKARITMENGQVWRQVDVGKLKNIGDGPPWTAEIRKAMLGSFLMKVGNSQAVHVERVN